MRDALGSVQSLLVLGGTSEIAVATTERLVAEGVDYVVLLGRDVRALDAAAAVLRRARHVEVATAPFDARAPDTHAAAIAHAFAAAGDIDLVLVAFGVLGDERTNWDPVEAAALVGVNFVGAVSCVLAAAERLKQQGHGTIAILSSVAGERVRRTNFVYGASKAGLDGFAQGLAAALTGTGVDVVLVRPGFVHTRMTAGLKPPPLSTTPEAVARALVGAVRNRQSIVWVPGSLRWIMVVLRHLPRAVFNKLPI